MSAPPDDERAALRAELAHVHRKTDAFGRALLFLAHHFANHLQGDQAMSATTDAVKARLVKLDTAVEQASASAAAIKAAADADEADMLEAKVEALPHAAAGSAVA